MELKDKVAIVTGSGRGIGAGIALVLAREGANLIVNDRKMTQDAEGRWSRRSKPWAAGPWPSRRTSPRRAKWTAMVAAAVKKFGAIDILVNNAGIEAVPVLTQGHSRGAMGPDPERQPQGRLSLLSGGDPADDEAEQRTNHQYRIAGRTPHGLLRQRRLHGLQVGSVGSRRAPGLGAG